MGGVRTLRVTHSATMVRPVVRASNHATEMEIKTLKLSYDNQTNVRAPMVWEKPTAGLYDYHYEIDGLYYQPMISYCIGRAAGGRRKVVDVPDRILSNYDKRSYKLKNNEVDYEGFLSKTYQRSMKDVNSKKIHCANESIQRSKKTTDLGMARGSAMMRDKYLNQVQMMYTEKLAREGKMKGLEVENFGGERSNSVRIVKTTGDVSEEYSKTEGGSKRKSLINKDYLAADNMNEFLKVRNNEMLMKEAVADAPQAPLFMDATYSKAIKDVRNRVKKEGSKCFMQKTQIDDLKLNYRGKKWDQVGNVEKAFVRSTMFATPAIPDIDVGYDVVG